MSPATIEVLRRVIESDGSVTLQERRSFDALLCGGPVFVSTEKAAALMGVHRTTFWRRMKRAGIAPRRRNGRRMRGVEWPLEAVVGEDS